MPTRGSSEQQDNATAAANDMPSASLPVVVDGKLTRMTTKDGITRHNWTLISDVDLAQEYYEDLLHVNVTFSDEFATKEDCLKSGKYTLYEDFDNEKMKRVINSTSFNEHAMENKKVETSFDFDILTKEFEDGLKDMQVGTPINRSDQKKKSKDIARVKSAEVMRDQIRSLQTVDRKNLVMAKRTNSVRAKRAGMKSE